MKIIEIQALKMSDVVMLVPLMHEKALSCHLVMQPQSIVSWSSHNLIVHVPFIKFTIIYY